ncbi:MAG TPA: glutamate--cysteine ligase, partial [Gammaproteobacteria bacterium]
SFAHLRLHNGTIWRWNRLLLGSDADARPHLRLEHRTLPAGPTLVDCIANAALFYGLVSELAADPAAPEQGLPFARARDNFYAAARDGLAAEVTWLNGRHGSVTALFVERLLATARRGLERLGVERGDRDDYLELIEARVRTGRTGSAWQRAWVRRHGADMHGLAAAYLDGQRSGRPVHEWEG